MACDVCLFLDTETENSVRMIWSILRTRGFSSPLLRSGGKPHLTLAIWEELRPESILDGLKAFAAGHRAFPITFSSIGTFGAESGTVFLGPVFTPHLLTVHEELYRIFGRLQDFAQNLYRPGSWVPHCSLTLGISPDYLTDALQTCMEIIDLPIRGLVGEIGLLTFDSGSVHSIRSFRLLPDPPRPETGS